ncbi:HTH-type transcriptional regulator CynR [Thalassoglobus neptunius]|uniref:HTH-type transcriptional regulator CynR n=1 Tax=Thalassoglobus neptunius TaxID=1938619 RepID=A0A5C5X7D7_9PLAN|nr:LysR family transcriptional regulator [Thalassoglobus neptunius]TWT58261.1 HTH-type transcriptional regulator CynR [Thalassoglobus neptunius]
MSLRNTEIFCEIATQRSFSRAASARQISQPAVSQALQQLEDQLGVALIDRSQRPIGLTPAGSVYFERCQKWLDDYREIEDAVTRFSGRLTGRVRVASIYSVGLLQMSDYVRKFRSEYPDVELSLDYVQPDEIYNRVLRDEVELGIVSFPKDGGDIGCLPWIDQEMVLAVAPEHPISDRESIRLTDLQGLDLVAFTHDLMIRRATEKLLRKSNVTMHVVHQFDNLETVKRAVEINLGVALLPLATLRRELEFQTLRAIPLSDCTFVRPLGIVHKRHKHLSRAAEKFVELLHEESPEHEPVSPFSTVTSSSSA